VSSTFGIRERKTMRTVKGVKNKSGGSIRRILPLLLLCLSGLFLLSGSGVFQQAAKNNNRSLSEFRTPAELPNGEGDTPAGLVFSAKQIVCAKEVNLEKSAEECVGLAASPPPAEKPEELIGVMRPTLSPLPTLPVVLGIQKKVLLPNGDFIPTSESQNNYWAGEVNGQTVQVLAGILREQEETWREDHPEWVEMGPQGAVEVLDSNWARIALVQTPTRNGYVHFVKECDSSLLLQAEDGKIFVFDLPEYIFIPDDLSSHSSSTGCQ
jgi:hypothetical protein